jgi:hypothetical protein
MWLNHIKWNEQGILLKYFSELNDFSFQTQENEEASYWWHEANRNHSPKGTVIKWSKLTTKHAAIGKGWSKARPVARYLPTARHTFSSSLSSYSSCRKFPNRPHRRLLLLHLCLLRRASCSALSSPTCGSSGTSAASHRQADRCS